jgi:effector-binding domain-containing protein
MRIIKYLLLLLLLALIGVFVYIATQKGDFTVTRSAVIAVPKTILFNYVNDYKNWEMWDSRKEDDPQMQVIYPENTIGLNAVYTWYGKKGDGKSQTVFVKENDSIAQKVAHSGTNYFSYIKFKDTVGGTKMSWSIRGKVSFMTKIYATLTGGVNNFMGTMLERNLNNLNNIITKEKNIFNVKVDGLVQEKGGFYIKQTVACKTSELDNKLHDILPKIVNFFKENNMVMNGKPFIIYEKNSADSLRFSVCAPLKEEIFISPGSDMSTGFFPPFAAVKAVLTGNYSHKANAYAKASDYIKANKLNRYYAINSIEILAKSTPEEKNPSKWVTEILIPVDVAVPQPQVSDSIPPVAKPADTKPTTTTIKPATTTTKPTTTTTKPTTTIIKPTTTTTKPTTTIIKPTTTTIKPATTTTKPTTTTIKPATTTKPTTTTTKPTTTAKPAAVAPVTEKSSASGTPAVPKPITVEKEKE